MKNFNFISSFPTGILFGTANRPTRKQFMKTACQLKSVLFTPVCVSVFLWMNLCYCIFAIIVCITPLLRYPNTCILPGMSALATRRFNSPMTVDDSVLNGFDNAPNVLKRIFEECCALPVL